MLGDKIKELRKSKNMYQQDLAAALSVSKSTVAMWETNKRIPDTSMLVKIAEYFDITADSERETKHGLRSHRAVACMDSRLQIRTY